MERASESVMTAMGWWKAPTRFLPKGKSTPVFPPTLASACDTRLVGIWTKSIPRRNVAAAKPPMSPVTPPPRVTTISVRVKPFSARARYISIMVDSCLFSSPAGKVNRNTGKPAAFRESSTRWP